MQRLSTVVMRVQFGAILLKFSTCRAIALLVLAAAGALYAEQCGWGRSTQFRLSGDLLRETRGLAQYGQFASVFIVSALVWTIGRSVQNAILVAVAPLTAGCVANVLKALVGRVRPGYTQGGDFLGLANTINSTHLSFPSAHTACAFALSAVLAHLYPRGRFVFWVLASVCGLLRWIDGAHWPGDVLAGAAVGLSIGAVAIYLLPRRLDTWLEPPLPPLQSGSVL